MPLPSKDLPFSENWFVASEKLADKIGGNPGGDDINTDTDTEEQGNALLFAY